MGNEGIYYLGIIFPYSPLIFSKFMSAYMDILPMCADVCTYMYAVRVRLKKQKCVYKGWLIHSSLLDMYIYAYIIIHIYSPNVCVYVYCFREREAGSWNLGFGVGT